MSKSFIQLEDVSKTYNLGKVQVQALQNASVGIDQEEFVAILGPSGSGKSTLLNIMSCLDTPTEGKVFLEGEDVSELSEDELADIRGKKIGFVFQQFNLLTHLNALENVHLPSIFQGTSSKEMKKRAEKLLDSVGLSDRLKHDPTELSGGEMQRVAMARSMINDPKILVTDEPTGNVDSETGENIMNILKELNQEGRTIIMVTHDQNLVEYADRIIRIKDGKLEDD